MLVITLEFLNLKTPKKKQHLLETVLPRGGYLVVWTLRDGANDVGLRVHALTRGDDFGDVTCVFHKVRGESVDENYVRPDKGLKIELRICLLHFNILIPSF